MKNCDIFLNFAQNIDCGVYLGPPHFHYENMSVQYDSMKQFLKVEKMIFLDVKM